MKALSIFAVTIMFVSQAAAQDRFVRVSAVGQIMAEPEVASISATLTGMGDTAAAAAADFTEKKSAVMDRFDPMKLGDVEIVIGPPELSRVRAGGGFAVPPAAARGLPGGFEPAPVAAAVELPKLKMVAIVSFNIELGGDFEKTRLSSIAESIADGIDESALAWTPFHGNGQLLIYSLNDEGAAREMATRKAFEQARKKAEVLAKLGGKRAGAVISIEESAGATVSSPYPMIAPLIRPAWTSAATPSSGPIPVTVHLQVTFELVD